jgi:hypothetical protein
LRREEGKAACRRERKMQFERANRAEQHLEVWQTVEAR